MKKTFDFNSSKLTRSTAVLAMALASYGLVQQALGHQVLQSQAPSQTKPAKSSEVRIPTGTVIMFRLTKTLSSKTSLVGDTFEAGLDTSGNATYQDLPENTILEGHVSFVSAKNVDTPGVLGLGFDRLRMSDGRRYSLKGALIPISDKSITKVGNRRVSLPAGVSRDYKFVGFGPAGGTLVSIKTKASGLPPNVLNKSLGFLYGDIVNDPTKSRESTLVDGTRFAVRLYRNLVVRVPLTH